MDRLGVFGVGNGTAVPRRSQHWINIDTTRIRL